MYKMNFVTKRLLARIIVLVLLSILVLLVSYFLKLIQQPKSTGYGPKTFKHIRSIFGPPGDRFKRPHDVAVDSKGNIYITDSAKGRVVAFDYTGVYIRTIGEKLESIATTRTQTELQGKLINPIGVGIDRENGDVYVADRTLNKVEIFESNGSYKRSIPVTMPLKPYVAKNKLYLTTYGPLQIFDKKGKLLSSLGSRGNFPEDFDFPNGLTFDSAENIWVADSNNNRIKALSKKGSVKLIDGSKTKNLKGEKLKYQLPSGITFDDIGLLYISDTFDFKIKVIAVQNKKLINVANFGAYGSRDGQFFYPAGIAYMGNRRFAIADEGNNRVQIVELPVTKKMQRYADMRKDSQNLKPPF